MLTESPFLTLLKNRINLHHIPFSERGSRLLVFLMNNHLSVRLAERWLKREGELTAYRQRPPILEDWNLTDGEGNELPITLVTYPHKIECHTPVGIFTITFVDSETLLVSLPTARCGMSFLVNFDFAQKDRRGGVLRLTGDIRRNMAYTTNARILKNTIQSSSPQVQQVNLILDAQEGSGLLLDITPRMGFNRYLPPSQEAIQAAAQRWHAWFSAAPPVAEEYQLQYYYAWWVMRAGLISTRFYTTREAMTPSKIHYVGIWQWDSYFHALAYRHIEMNLAKDQLRILLDHQRADGMIPDAVHDEGTITHLDYPVKADVTKPPLIAWAAWKLYEIDGDLQFLDEIYEPVVRWNDWWFERNDLNTNGLCEYQHPYSSGLDDSPLWDDGMPVESPDLNTYLCMQQESLANIASVIGESQDVSIWSERARAMVDRMIRRMWDPAAGLFWAKRKGRPIRIRTPFSLFPMVTGLMPPDISKRLVEHLTDKSQFWPQYPVPTVALDDPHYDPNQMWRGPTWVNVNYLLIEGLMKSGYADLARELRRLTLALIGSHDDIYEYYHPETGAQPPKAASIFGWSSAVFIDLAIQASREAEAEKRQELSS